MAASKKRMLMKLSYLMRMLRISRSSLVGFIRVIWLLVTSYHPQPIWKIVLMRRSNVSSVICRNCGFWAINSLLQDLRTISCSSLWDCPEGFFLQQQLQNTFVSLMNPMFYSISPTTNYWFADAHTLPGSKLRNYIRDYIVAEGPYNKPYGDKFDQESWDTLLQKGGDLVVEVSRAGGFANLCDDFPPFRGGEQKQVLWTSWRGWRGKSGLLRIISSHKVRRQRSQNCLLQAPHPPLQEKLTFQNSDIYVQSSTIHHSSTASLIIIAAWY